MENFLYNYFGYNQETVENNSAIIIQKAYRNYCDYKKKRISDYVKYFGVFNSHRNQDLDKDNKEELDYWENQRYLIKKKLIGDYVIIK